MCLSRNLLSKNVLLCDDVNILYRHFAESNWPTSYQVQTNPTRVTTLV